MKYNAIISLLFVLQNAVVGKGDDVSLLMFDDYNIYVWS